MVYIVKVTLRMVSLIYKELFNTLFVIQRGHSSQLITLSSSNIIPRILNYLTFNNLYTLYLSN